MAREGILGIPAPSRRLADAGLALLVVAVVALMIVPLPTWTLDLLLASNLSMSIAILLVVLYVPDAIGIATFPTVLLLTTLFRLGLNVASTRLILLQANAGAVIRAFGSFVVRGNYVVGAVVFLILTIIQFVVIAKGSERVAEVGARFVLDAMPGKQMAIDAELRAGTIDGAEARRRRRQLSRESQFYGAMDGAVKFVKGDVIASLIIIVVNILGGLAIGVVQHGLGVEDALRRYGLLTIGEGLVTQIPALVLSTAAGVLVTRVASEEADTPLGEELARQLLGVPRALGAASAFVIALAFVPGLPALPFLAIGGALAFAARTRSRRLAIEARRAATEPPAAPSRDRRETAFVPMVVPWSVEVSSDLAALLDSPAPETGLRAIISALREEIFAELGVPLPLPRVRTREGLGARRVLLTIHEVPARAMDVPPAVEGVDASRAVAGAVAETLRARAADFLGLSETQRLLDELEQLAPATVRNVVPKPVPLPVLADILRRLVEEHISIRDLRAVLEALAAVAPAEKDPLNLAEYVRAQLRRAITYRLTRGDSRLDVVLLDTVLEDTIRRAVTRTPAGAFLTLPPAAARDVVRSIRAAVDLSGAAGDRGPERASGAAGDRPPTILTQPDIRRFVRKLLESELPTVEVVSYAELLPEVALRPLARALPT